VVGGSDVELLVEEHDQVGRDQKRGDRVSERGERAAGVVRHGRLPRGWRVVSFALYDDDMGVLADELSLDALTEALVSVWSRSTSFDPALWSQDNPAWGQCAVTALVVQDFFGGDLLHGYVEGTEHYWNRLPGGKEIDVTWRQFPADAPSPAPRFVDRSFVLSFPATQRRYELLREATRRRLPAHRSKS
jgi:hypothetical protein